MSENYLYLILGIALLVVILIAIIVGRSFKTKINENGFEMGADEGKGNVVVRKIKNKSEIAANTSADEHNIGIEDIDNSKININKEKFQK